MYTDINVIYNELHNEQKMSEYLATASEEEILTMVGAIFEQSLAGTCMQTWERCLEGYNIVLEDLFKVVKERTVTELLDELVFECDGCGWWCTTGEANDGDGEVLCDDCMDSY